MVEGAAATELEVGTEPREAEHRIRSARIEIGIDERLLDRVDEAATESG